MSTRTNQKRAFSPAVVTFLAVFASLCAFALIVVAPYARPVGDECGPRIQRGGFVQVDSQCRATRLPVANGGMVRVETDSPRQAP